MNAPPGLEDPISATFDLSDRVAQLAPTVRRMYRYTASILVLWIVIMAILIVVSLRGLSLISVLPILGLVAGILALSMLRETDRFFRIFVQRHRLIRLLREADPVVKVPEGRTPVERLARYLQLSSPAIDSALREDPGRLRFRVGLPFGKRTVPFDLVLDVPGGLLFRTVGIGEPGFALLARNGPEAPTRADLEALAADAQAVAPSVGGAVVRLILLRTQPIPLPEEVYEYAVGHPVTIRRGLHETRVPVEIITESRDGSYEFVPYVLGVP